MIKEDNFNYSLNLKKCFSKRLFDYESDELDEVLIKKCVDIILNEKERITGFLRFNTIKTRLINYISKSVDIKLGNILEDFFERLIESKYHLLDKIIYNGTKKYACDQLFEDENTVYLIEQKIRDDHDSTKMRGQIKNFEEKINTLCKMYKDKKIIGYQWFIDDLFHKNQNFYESEFNKLNKKLKSNNVEIYLEYGGDIINKLMNDASCFDNFIAAYDEIKINYYSRIPEIIAQCDFNENECVLNELVKHYSKADELFTKPEYEEIRKELFANQKSKKNFTNKLENISENINTNTQKYNKMIDIIERYRREMGV